MTNIQEMINNSSFPIVVRASAGTGKTYSLVEKVKHCVETGINPINILVFSFTVDAANELKNRVINGALMTIGTMHSVMLQIIREHGKKRYFVLDNGSQSRFVMDIFKEMKIDFDNYNSYMSIIGLAKNTFTNYYELLEDSPQLLETFFGNKKILTFAIEYEKKKEHSHKIDFDDMTLKAYKILNENPSILDNRQERWKYIFVDEAQDLCIPQSDVIRLLGRKYKNVFAVGDEKQAIYYFRASDSTYLRNFKQEYPEANEFVLPTTYRCSKAVTKAGNSIASVIDKSIIDTANPIEGNIDVNTSFETQRDEAAWVSDIAIEEFQASKSVKILYRTNAQSLTYQLIMLNNNIPFSINQATSIFYTKEAKLALACCDLLFSYNRMSSAEKIAVIQALRPILTNKFGLYDIIGQMKKSDKCPFDNPESFRSNKTADTLSELLFLKETISKASTISTVINTVSLMVENSLNTFSPTAVDNLIGIAEFAADCKSMQELRSLIEIIQRPRLLAPGERAISLSTIHGAKGLEADIVFLTGVCDNLLPHKFGLQQEELNLMYVGVTRARQNLYVTGFASFGMNEYKSHSYVNLI